MASRARSRQSSGSNTPRARTPRRAVFSYDPGLQPAPWVEAYSPVGSNIPVGAKMFVRFSEPMDPSSINERTVYVDGVPGTTTWDAAKNTATFKPSQRLPFGTHTCVVKGGPDGVRSTEGTRLVSHLPPVNGAPDPNQDSWRFTAD